MEIFTNDFWNTVVIPVLTAVMWVIRTGIAERFYRFLPLVSIVLGILLAGWQLGFGWDGVFSGIVLGLAASGFYDVARRTALNVK